MIIKHPEKENIPALTHLWAEAFGDPEDFIRGFFRTGYAPERCLLAEEAGKVLAALYWFDCLWEEKKVAYLYAIATDQDHRGKGICRALMEKTHAHLAKTGCAGAILVPADEGLARMYGKMGYAPCCPVTKPADMEMPTKIHEISGEEYRKLRPNYLPEGAVHHREAAFSYLATFAKFYRFPGGICCGNVSENKLCLQELLPLKADAPIDLQFAMYCSFTNSENHPAYFALPLN